MVRLYHGAVRGRGRLMVRPPFMNRPMRPIRPNGFEHEILPFARGMGRGRLLRPGPPRPQVPLPPRMGPPLPPRPPMPHMAEMRSHPRPLLGLRPGIMPPMLPPRPMIPPGLLLRRPMRSGPGALIGRGRMVQRGVGPKRLGSSANGQIKKPQKRKEKTEVYYLVPLSIAQKSKWKKKGTKLHIFNDHTFIAKHLPGGTECQVCRKVLPRRLGKQGYECRDCLLRCHKHCHIKADNTCPSSNIQSIELCADVSSPFSIRRVLGQQDSPRSK